MTGQLTTRVLPDNEPNPLIALFRGCTLRIDDGSGNLLGTGFFVAPGLVVTCAHVIWGAGRLTVLWGDRRALVQSSRAMPTLESVSDPDGYPLPDLAVLNVADARQWNHPCPGLATEPPVLAGSSDPLYLAGYTVEHGSNPALTGATTGFDSPVTEDGHSFYKLKHGQILPGFSGSPLLNLRAGLVAAVVESSRGRHADLGGFAVPVVELAAAFPDVIEANQRYHSADSRWVTAIEAERTLAAEREGKQGRLPLQSPVVDLAPAEDVSAATLLRPRHAVVAYVGRERLLGDLAAWCETDQDGSWPQLWFITGAGGFGKTRLAVQACMDAQARGWTAGFLRPTVTHASLQALAEWPGRLLIAVDYAETRPALLARLIEERTARSPRSQMRVLLLVRRRVTRPELLAMFNEERDEALAGLMRRARLSRLDEATATVDRDVLFDQAVRDLIPFITDSSRAARVKPKPELEAAHFARPLYVLVAAALASASRAADLGSLSELDLLRELLSEHEARYWERWDKRRGLGLDPADQRIAVAIATLLTAHGDEEALTVARLIPHHRGEPESRLIAIARWLAQIYPTSRDAGQIIIGPLEPDRLGEVLVGDVLRQHPDLLAAAIGAASDRQVTRALTVTARIAQDNPIVRRQLRAVLDQRLPDLFQRGFNASG